MFTDADRVWLKKHFDKLEQQNLIIIKMLEGGNLTPELEGQVRLAAKLAGYIDSKVPDANVPPGTKPPQ